MPLSSIRLLALVICALVGTPGLAYVALVFLGLPGASAVIFSAATVLRLYNL